MEPVLHDCKVCGLGVGDLDWGCRGRALSPITLFPLWLLAGVASGPRRGGGEFLSKALSPSCFSATDILPPQVGLDQQTVTLVCTNRRKQFLLDTADVALTE